VPKQQNVWKWTVEIPQKRISRPAEWISVSKVLLHAVQLSDMAWTYLPEQEIEFRVREKSTFKIFKDEVQGTYSGSLFQSDLFDVLTKIKPMNMTFRTCQSSGKNRKKPTRFKLLHSIMGLSSLALYFYEYCHGNACSVGSEASTSILLGIQVSSDVMLPSPSTI